MALELKDLDYRVRNHKTDNVIAAFPDNTMAAHYALLMNHKGNGFAAPATHFKVETTNPGTLTTPLAPLAQQNMDHEWFLVRREIPSGQDALNAAVRVDDVMRGIDNGASIKNLKVEDICILIEFVRNAI